MSIDINHVIVNPTEKEIDDDLEKSEQIVVLHYNKEGNFEKWVKDWIYKFNSLGFDIIYIHYYTGDKSITLGLKTRD